MPRGPTRLTPFLAIAGVLAAIVAILQFRGAPPDVTLDSLRTQGFPVTFDEIRARYPKVPDERNAYLHSIGPARRIAGTDSSAGNAANPPAHLPRNAEPSPDWRAHWIPLIESNKTALAELEHGLSLPASWDGTDVTGLPDTQPMWIAGSILQARIEDASAAHRTAEAVQSLTNLLRLSWVSDGSAAALAGHFSLALRRRALDSLENLLTRNQLTSADLDAIGSAINTARREGSIELSFARALAFFNLHAQSLCEWRRPNQNSAVPIHKQVLDAGYRLTFMRRDHQLLLSHHARMLNLTRLPLAEQPGAAHAEFRALLQMLPPADVASLNLVPDFVPGPVSRRLMGPYHWGILVDDASPEFDRDIADRTRLLAARTACAVERWRLRHQGRVPDSLEELRPQLLERTPADPIDGKPMRYRKRTRGYCIYSIGTDLKDNGGLEAEPAFRQPHDVTFIVER